MSKNNNNKKVRFIKPPNILKQKVGIGGIDELLLERSQEAINTTEVDFTPYAVEFLRQFSEAAQKARTGGDFDGAMESIIIPVMHLKANGGMFRYQLLSDVADIAMQFLDNIEQFNDDSHEVIKAHETTLKVIINSKLKGDGGREGYALIKELDQACQRYYNKYAPQDAV